MTISFLETTPLHGVSILTISYGHHVGIVGYRKFDSTTERWPLVE